MLKSYEGTILFVSHDRDFINQIATDILEFEGKSINIYQKKDKISPELRIRIVIKSIHKRLYLP